MKAEDEKIKEEAEKFARANRQRIAKELTDINKYPADSIPGSFFMAGSPGAGKTEVSRNLVKILQEQVKGGIILIDADELRKLFLNYTGNNSYLFQIAVSLIVEKIHDAALENKQSFLLDGTLSKYEKAVDNVRRSLKRNRMVFIFYVYQKPEVAWKFTQARELEEGRNIPRNAFIQQFIDSRETVEKIRKEFKDDEVSIFIFKKDFETHIVETIEQIKSGEDSFDRIIGKRYTKDELENLL